MNSKDFRCPEAGNLVPIAGGQWAFVPATLTAELGYDTTLTLALSRADAALSELAGFGRVLLFDPTNADSAAYNPLLEVRRGEWEVRDVQNVADVLVDP